MLFHVFFDFVLYLMKKILFLVVLVGPLKIHFFASFFNSLYLPEVYTLSTGFDPTISGASPSYPQQRWNLAAFSKLKYFI